MENSILVFDESIFILTAAGIFVLLFVVILHVLRQYSSFGHVTAVVAALCVSVLCIMGLKNFLLSGEGNPTVVQYATKSDNQTGIEIILLPYTVLAIVIILVVLLLGLAKIFPSQITKGYRREAPHRATKPRRAVQKVNEEKRIRK